VAFQILQLAESIYHRKRYRDKTGDPWNGRTLEWSIPSPAPFYNYAISPVVDAIDPFWKSKQQKVVPSKKHYEPILIPKNSIFGALIGLSALAIGFGIVWQIWWLSILFAVILGALIIIKNSRENFDYVLSAKELKQLDTELTT
jgi:cytochrome o ubiquinol oxidase subunit 1